MRSPIKNLKKQTNSFSTIRELIPKGSVIESHLFYDGTIEFNLAESDRFVISNTDRYVVYEFWRCAIENPKRIAQIAERLFPTLNEQTFDILQKDWARQRDPYVRSAFFFLLNRCSDLGMITHGEFNTKNYTPFALSLLRQFAPKNFHLTPTLEQKLEESVGTIEPSTHVLIHAGKFSYNLFEHGATESLEETKFNHNKLLERFPMNNKKAVIIYDFHPRLKKEKDKFDLIFLDQSGKITDEPNAKEVILHNV
jgi:hypothetical protein